MQKPAYLYLISCLLALILTACEQKPTSPAATHKVTGEAFYLQKIALPDDAVLTLRLEDVSLADVPALLLSEQRIELKGRQQPFAFELGYHPSQLTEGHVYAVSGRIEDASGLRFINTEQHSLLLAGQDATLRLKLDQVTAQGAASALSVTPNFNCQGNEPFWGLELRKDELKLSRLMKKVEEKTYTGRFSRYSALDGGAGYQWQGLARKDKDATVVADIWLEHCLDSMAGPEEGGEYDYQIILSVGDEQLNGCCRLMVPTAAKPIAYQCEDGQRLTARPAGQLPAEAVLIQLADGASLRLERQASASGARYVYDEQIFWVKGNEARLTLAGKEPQTCQRLGPD